MIVLYSSRFWK